MSFFYHVGGIISVCCVICGALGIISPLGNTKKMMNVVIGIFFLAVVLTPFTKISFDFSENLFNFPNSDEISEEYKDLYDKEVIRTAQDKLCEYADSILKEEGINANDIRIILETDDTGGIYVKEIDIYINQEQIRMFKTKINSVIKDDFKVFPNIITVDERKEE